MAVITVPSAYQGMPGIAHGGYVAGLLTHQAREPLSVTLRQPPPLDTPLSIEYGPDGLTLCDPHGHLIADGRAGQPLADGPPLSPVEPARSPTPHPRFSHHPYPACFVCGTHRDDGLRLRVAPPDDTGVAAAVWDPSSPLLPNGDVVPPTFVWAVVDCLTAWSFADHWGDAHWWPAVTGQLTVTATAHVPRDGPCVAAGRLSGRQGRRITVQAAVGDPEGQVCARAEAVWVVVPEIPIPARR